MQASFQKLYFTMPLHFRDKQFLLIKIHRYFSPDIHEYQTKG